MRRGRKTIEVFSISAIDLFAGAMGAFALISIMLFPSYLKVSKTAGDRDDLIKQISQLQAENSQLKKQVEDHNVTVFLGLVSSAKSFVLLVDMSASMKAYTPIMTRTVSQMVKKLDDTREFQLIGFQGDAASVSMPVWQGPASSVLAASPANKASALAFADGLSLKFDGGTPTFEALDLALGSQAEAIILLSDGEPNDDRLSPDDIVAEITKKNKASGAAKKIYSVAIGEYGKTPGLVKFLSDLARENSGEFIGVSQ